MKMAHPQNSNAEEEYERSLPGSFKEEMESGSCQFDHQSLSTFSISDIKKEVPLGIVKRSVESMDVVAILQSVETKRFLLCKFSCLFLVTCRKIIQYCLSNELLIFLCLDIYRQVTF